MLQYYDRFRTWCLVAVAWHAGPGSAEKVRSSGVNPETFIDRAAGTNTGIYLRRVMQCMDENIVVEIPPAVVEPDSKEDLGVRIPTEDSLRACLQFIHDELGLSY